MKMKLLRRLRCHVAVSVAGFAGGARVSGSPRRWPAGCRKEPPAKAFLNSIYQHYLGSSSGEAKGVPLSNAKLVRGYFTVGLASLILEDRATAAKRGEPPVLDGDPFMGHQDWDVSNPLRRGEGYRRLQGDRHVSFTNSGKPERSSSSSSAPATNGASPISNGIPARCAGSTGARPPARPKRCRSRTERGVPGPRNRNRL